MGFLSVCALFHLFQVIVSQPSLSQSPQRQAVPAGSVVKLNCHIQGSAATIIHWYKQRERSDMKLVYTASKLPSAVGRLSSEFSSEKGHWSLFISDAWRNDSGMYYCVIRNYANMALIFGNGSKLVITAGSPSIFLLAPPQDAIPSMERVPLLCLVRGLSPASFPVSWNVSGGDSEGQTDSGTIEPDGTYTIRSYTSLSAKSWGSGVLCSCAVQINSSVVLSATVSHQRDSPSPSICYLPHFGGLAVALLSLGIVLLIGRRICRNQQTDTVNSDEELTDSKSHQQNKETLYARLAFNEDPTL